MYTIKELLQFTLDNIVEAFDEIAPDEINIRDGLCHMPA